MLEVWSQLLEDDGILAYVACDAVQGVCEGAIVVAEQRSGDVPLVIRPGAQIKRGEQPLMLHELALGAPIKAFTFPMSGEPDPRVVLLEVTDGQ